MRESLHSLMVLTCFGLSSGLAPHFILALLAVCSKPGLGGTRAAPDDFRLDRPYHIPDLKPCVQVTVPSGAAEGESGPRPGCVASALSARRSVSTPSRRLSRRPRVCARPLRAVHRYRLAGTTPVRDESSGRDDGGRHRARRGVWSWCRGDVASTDDGVSVSVPDLGSKCLSAEEWDRLTCFGLSSGFAPHFILALLAVCSKPGLDVDLGTFSPSRL